MTWQLQKWCPPYCHSHFLADWMGFPEDRRRHSEPELILCAEAASRAIDKATGRQFGRVAEPQVRIYTAEWFKDRWVIDIDDLMTTDGLVVEVAGAEITDYVLTPVNAVAKGFPWTSLEVLPYSAVKPTGKAHEVRITALWGWESIPRAIETACMIQAARLYERRTNPNGPLTSKQVDDVRYGWRSTATPELDADVLASIAPYRKLWFAV